MSLFLTCFKLFSLPAITATPAPGWKFVQWEGATVDAQNEIVITDNITIIAVFEKVPFTLTLETKGEGSITASSDGPYYYGDEIVLTAIPNQGWTFLRWEGDISSDEESISLEINGNMTLLALFTYLISPNEQREITVPCASGSLHLTIPKGSVEESAPLIVEAIELSGEQLLAAEGFSQIGLVYEMNDIRLINNATLIFSYNDENNDGMVDGTNVPKETLKVFRWEDNIWKQMDAHIDLKTNTISVDVNRLGTYIVMAYISNANKLINEVAFLANPFEPEIQGETALKMILQKPARVVLTIWNKRGNKIIYKIEKDFDVGGYNQSLTWDGRDTLKRRVPSGIYIYQVTATSGDKQEKLNGLLSVKRGD